MFVLLVIGRGIEYTAADCKTFAESVVPIKTADSASNAEYSLLTSIEAQCVTNSKPAVGDDSCIDSIEKAHCPEPGCTE